MESLEFYNAQEVKTSPDQTQERGDLSWSALKVGEIARHDWDLSNYPFDRQVLQIDLEEGVEDTTTMVYSADTANSGYNEDIVLAGWRITDFALEERIVDYDTTFGDPDISGESNYTRLVASVEIQRESVTLFLKLVAGVYAAIAVVVLSFLMLPDQPTVFGARMVVLVGALFSTVVSMRASEAALAESETMSLVDKIHVVALAYVFTAALMAVLSRNLCESGKVELAKRRERISLYAFGGSFVLLNGLLIAMAVIIG